MRTDGSSIYSVLFALQEVGSAEAGLEFLRIPLVTTSRKVFGEGVRLFSFDIAFESYIFGCPSQRRAQKAAELEQFKHASSSHTTSRTGPPHSSCHSSYPAASSSGHAHAPPNFGYPGYANGYVTHNGNAGTRTGMGVIKMKVEQEEDQLIASDDDSSSDEEDHGPQGAVDREVEGEGPREDAGEDDADDDDVVEVVDDEEGDEGAPEKNATEGQSASEKRERSCKRRRVGATGEHVPGGPAPALPCSTPGIASRVTRSSTAAMNGGACTKTGSVNGGGSQPSPCLFQHSPYTVDRRASGSSAGNSTGRRAVEWGTRAREQSGPSGGRVAYTHGHGSSSSGAGKRMGGGGYANEGRSGWDAGGHQGHGRWQEDDEDGEGEEDEYEGYIEREREAWGAKRGRVNAGGSGSFLGMGGQGRRWVQLADLDSPSGRYVLYFFACLRLFIC